MCWVVTALQGGPGAVHFNRNTRHLSRSRSQSVFQSGGPKSIITSPYSGPLAGGEDGLSGEVSFSQEDGGSSTRSPYSGPLAGEEYGQFERDLSGEIINLIFEGGAVQGGVLCVYSDSGPLAGEE